ncbi:diguanylate cyclase (GGDEF)-like protein/PAS domain S-box-containing protein [Bacillus ectoiniformans]|uniref:PAS domain S-box protein n=1 Tax=Bacillus ectoiniformans TaxID=1494429 RepID=UPI00195C3C86|nr:PAS domain S-box protein [Bacillus ectoiniformans]MBM7648672.1 diguanylate cyclase (GGDEF)-like protein/PAS domain S-box-containing protein [Bacillus ectoiniformans]
MQSIHFSYYFNAMEEWVFLVEKTDQDLFYVELNDAARNGLGTSVLGKRLQDVLPPERYHYISEYYYRCIEEKKPVQYGDLNLFSAKAEASETTISPVIEEDGSCYRAIAITKSMARHKKKEEEYQFMTSFLSHTADAVLIVGTDYRILKINEAFEDLFGWKQEDILGKKWLETGLVPESEYINVNVALKKLAKGGKTIAQETYRLNKQKHLMPLSISYSPLMNEQGELVAYSMIYRDIHYLKRLENELAISKQEYKSLFTYNSDAIFMIDSEGVIIKANDACERVSGYASDEIIGVDFKRFLMSKDQEEVLGSIGEIKSYDLTIFHKEGSTISLECTNVPIIVEGYNRGTYIIAEDVTEQRLTERKLAQSLRDLQNYKEALDASAIVAITDTRGVITYVNDMLCSISGYKREELIGRTHRVLNSNYHSSAFFEEMWATITDGQVWKGEVRNQRKDGSYYWLQTTIIPLLDVDGEITHYAAIRTDITDKKHAIEALKENEEKYRVITENSLDLIKVLNADHQLTYASPSYRYMLGLEEEQLMRHGAFHAIAEEDQPILKDLLDQIHYHQEAVTAEYRYITPNESALWVETKGTPVIEEGELHSIILSGRIITERKQYEEQLQHQANHDSLTGLANRRYLQEKIDEVQQLAENGQEAGFAILLLDCDHFKSINDTFGHQTGDELLIEFAKRLKSCVRNWDVVARLGGDEFVVLVRNVLNQKMLHLIAERIMEELRKEYVLSEHTIQATSSMGVALYANDETTAEKLIQQADQALYRAKENRNTYHIFGA